MTTQGEGVSYTKTITSKITHIQHTIRIQPDTQSFDIVGFISKHIPVGCKLESFNDDCGVLELHFIETVQDKV